MLPDELIASILAYVPGTDLLKYLKLFNKWSHILPKYGKMFNISFDAISITDTDLYYLRGVHAINLRFCYWVTDAGLALIKGVGGPLGLEYQSLHTVNLAGCGITNAGLAHLKGIHTVNLSYCGRITDAGLAHLKGVHTVNLSSCGRITDAGLEHLKGVHTVDLSWCGRVTDT